MHCSYRNINVYMLTMIKQQFLILKVACYLPSFFLLFSFPAFLVSNQPVTQLCLYIDYFLCMTSACLFDFELVFSSWLDFVLYPLDVWTIFGFLSRTNLWMVDIIW